MSHLARFDDRIPAEISAALEDTARICPVFAGPGWLHGNTLTLRLPEGDLDINAPARLLKKVFALCDGSRALAEIIASLPEAARDEFQRFMQFLFAEGALIDAVLLTRRAAVFGYQTTTVGESAPNALTARLARRFTLGALDEEWVSHTVAEQDAPLDAFFASRLSTYTFSPHPIEAATLAAFLWSAGGILRADHERAGAEVPRRTVPSAGGMHLIEWRLALQKPIGPHPPGLYALSFPNLRELALKRLPGDIAALPRCFHKPWQLGASTGVLFALADAHIASLRYRNRAVQYLFLEAGAAFQNLSLSAQPLGLACAQIGGYSDEHVAEFLGAGRQMVLGSLIFGAQPSAETLDADRQAHPIEFVWSDSPNPIYTLPFHIARARPRGVTDDSRNTWGRDPDPRLAYIKAHAEAVERDGMAAVREVVVARIDELPRAIAPAQLAGYSPAQYRRPGFPHQVFDPAATHHWRAGVGLIDGAPTFIPAQFIHGREALAQLPAQGGSLLQSNSSGCAAGPTREAAILAALLEVIERDAFMRHWLAQRPGQGIAASILPGEIAVRIRQMEEAGCIVRVQRLESRFAQVVLVSARHDARHFTAVGAAARACLIEATAGALDELETTVYTRLLGHEMPALHPLDVRTPEHHTLLYAQRRYYCRAERVLTSESFLPAPAFLDSAKGSDSSLTALLDKMAASQIAPCVVDITPARCQIDQGRIRLHVVKAAVPGLVPIAFGAGLEPRGMVDECSPGSRFPHPFP